MCSGKSRLVPVLMLLLCCLVACGQEASADNALPPRSAAQPTAMAGPKGAATAIKAPCVVQSQVSVKLKAELGGRLDAVTANLGQAVRAGQLLARLDTREQQLDLARWHVAHAQATQRLAMMEVQRAQTQAQWDAVKALYKADVAADVSKEALQVREREAAMALARLDLDDLALQKQRLDRQLGQTEIRSPIDGVVLARNAEVGMVIAPGVTGLNGSDVIFEVGDPLRLRAECAARELDAARLRLGTAMRLQLDGQREAALEVHLSRVAPAVQNDGSGSSLLFWADFQRPDQMLVLPGMHATVTMAPTP